MSTCCNSSKRIQEQIDDLSARVEKIESNKEGDSIFCDMDMNSFTVNRGDTFILPLYINQGSKLEYHRYILKPEDRIYVGIMEPKQSFEYAVIRKLITAEDTTDDYGNPLLKLDPRDTEYLVTGKYFIMIKLKQEDGTVTTILPMKEFWITGTSKDPEDSDNISNITSPDNNYEEDLHVIYDGGII